MANDGSCGAFEAQEPMYALAVENSGTGVWDRDVVNGHIYYSRAWKAMLGYAEHEVSTRIEDSYQRVHPDDLARVQASIAAHFDLRTPSYAVEHRLRCKDGSYKWVLSRGRVVERDAQGRPLRMAGTTTDLTDTAALSEKLRQSAELLAHLTNEVPGLVYQYRQEAGGRATFTYASAGIVDLFGTTPQAAARDAGAVEAFIHPEDLSTYRDSLRISAQTLERWHLEFRVLRPGMAEIWCQGEARPRRSADGGTVWHGFISDITERKIIEKRLLEAASTDFLTGLPNRRHIMERMEMARARQQREPDSLYAVLMFDLDHFKNINDVHGHATGDEVLKVFSQVLLQELRKVDVVGRIGGEEFAVLLAGADIDDARGFAERVRARLAALHEAHLGVTASVGLTALHPQDPSIAVALSRADAALYRAKLNGRDRVEAG